MSTLVPKSEEELEELGGPSLAGRIHKGKDAQKEEVCP